VVRLTATGESLLADPDVARLYLGAGALAVTPAGLRGVEPPPANLPPEGAR
jgi:hypothetical protein